MIRPQTLVHARTHAGTDTAVIDTRYLLRLRMKLWAKYYLQLEFSKNFLESFWKIMLAIGVASFQVKTRNSCSPKFQIRLANFNHSHTYVLSRDIKTDLPLGPEPGQGLLYTWTSSLGTFFATFVIMKISKNDSNIICRSSKNITFRKIWRA